MAGQLKTDPKLLKHRLEAARTSATWPEVGQKVGIDGSMVREWLHRRGYDVTKLLKPIDPIARAEREGSNARVKREHGELLEEVAALRKLRDVKDKLAYAPLPQIKRREFGSGVREATAIALASDWHVEERVRPGDTPVGNAYNLKIAELRIDRYFQGLAWLVKFHRGGFKIRELVLWLGGDLMSGHIHEENVETSAMSPIKTMLWLQPQLIRGIEWLRDELQLDRVLVPCSYGNHGRDTHKTRYATGAHHSYEWSMYQQIAMHFNKKGTRVIVESNESAHQYAQIYDWTSHWHHGDGIRYAGGVGGITIPTNKAVAQWDQARHADFHWFGHYHQLYNMGRVAGNGSLIGYNSFAMGVKATPEPPQQLFGLIDSKRAKCCVSPIWAGDPSAEAALVGDM